MVRGRSWREMIVRSDPVSLGKLYSESFSLIPLADIFVHGNFAGNRLTMSTGSVKLWQ
jgi:hypothetical protein